MNWRERFAEWITGGARASCDCNAFYRAAYRQAKQECESAMRKQAREMRMEREHIEARLGFCIGTLQRIAAQETPGANSTVRRMASIAREALK